MGSWSLFSKQTLVLAGWRGEVDGVSRYKVCQDGLCVRELRELWDAAV